MSLSEIVITLSLFGQTLRILKLLMQSGTYGTNGVYGTTNNNLLGGNVLGGNLLGTTNTGLIGTGGGVLGGTGYVGTTGTGKKNN